MTETEDKKHGMFEGVSYVFFIHVDLFRHFIDFCFCVVFNARSYIFAGAHVLKYEHNVMINAEY